MFKHHKVMLPFHTQHPTRTHRAHPEWIQLTENVWEKLREEGLVRSEESEEDEGREDGFWGELDVSGEVVWGEVYEALGVMWVGWEAVVVMVPNVNVTWLCDGICPASMITNFLINIDAPETAPFNHLGDPEGDVNEIIESLVSCGRLCEGGCSWRSRCCSRSCNCTGQSRCWKNGGRQESLQNKRIQWRSNWYPLQSINFNH